MVCQSFFLVEDFNFSLAYTFNPFPFWISNFKDHTCLKLCYRRFIYRLLEHFHWITQFLDEKHNLVLSFTSSAFLPDIKVAIRRTDACVFKRASECKMKKVREPKHAFKSRHTFKACELSSLPSLGPLADHSPHRKW